MYMYKIKCEVCHLLLGDVDVTLLEAEVARGERTGVRLLEVKVDRAGDTGAGEGVVSVVSALAAAVSQSLEPVVPPPTIRSPC